MPLKLQKGIPIPSDDRVRTDIGKTYRKMEVGDSFEVDPATISRPNLYHLAAYAQIKVTVRQLINEETGEKCYRVWRIE
jgi:hypothetical protein